MAHKNNKTFKTPMMDSCNACNNNFQKLNQKFEVAVVGLQTVNGRYVLNHGEENAASAAMIVEGNKEFTMAHALKIFEHVNTYMPNLSTGTFKTEVDGIKFNCRVARV